MKEVYLIERHEYREEGSDQSVVAVHATLAGAIEDFNEIVEMEKTEYLYGETGSTDHTPEDLENAGVEEKFNEDPDGTKSYHIWRPTGWNELFIHIFKYKVLA